MKQLFWILGWFCCGLLPQTLPAQLSEADTLKWEASLSSTGTLLTGNIERFLWNNRFVVKHVQPRWGFIQDLQYRYGTIFRNRTEDDIFSRTFFYYDQNRRFYPYQMTWLERNLRRRIDSRWQLGLGATWRAVNRNGQLLKWSLMYSFEDTNYPTDEFAPVPPDDPGFELRTTRLTTRVFGRHQFRAGRWSLYYEAWFQQSLRQGDNFRYHYDVSLSTRLVGSLSLNALLQVDHERIVPAGVKQDDLSLLFGLRYALP